MQIGMRQVPAGTIEWFRTACNEGGLSRTALAREFCLREGWTGGAGVRPACRSGSGRLPLSMENTAWMETDAGRQRSRRMSESPREGRRKNWSRRGRLPHEVRHDGTIPRVGPEARMANGILTAIMIVGIRVAP